MNPLDQPATKAHGSAPVNGRCVVPIVQLFLEKPETRIPVASAGMGYHPSAPIGFPTLREPGSRQA